MNNTKDSRMLE